MRPRRRITMRTALLGVVALAMAALCVRLGIWQLGRLDERRARNALVQARGQGTPAGLATLRGRDTAETHWRRVRIEGVALYDAEMLHAARSQAGMPGVHLLTPLRPLDGAWGDTAIVVVRGYIASPDGRTIDQPAAREGDTLRFDALVLAWPPPRAGVVRLASARTAVRWLDRDTIATAMGRPIAPFMLLALGDTVVRDVTRPARVPPPSLGEGPHFSYAMQWFGFALVAIVGFGVFAYAQRGGA